MLNHIGAKKTRTKILYIHHGKGLGGAPLSLLYLVKNLDKTLYDPVVLFLHDSPVIKLFKDHDITTMGPVNLYDFPHTKIWSFSWYHVKPFFRAVKDTLRTIFSVAPSIFNDVKPDIIHLNTSSLLGWGIVASRLKIPVVWHVREPLAHGYLGIRRLFVKYIVGRYASSIVPISINDALPWQEYSKTKVVYNAVDPAVFDASLDASTFRLVHGMQDDTPIILFVGGVSQEKGTHVILQSFIELLKRLPTAKLVIAGSWDLSDALWVKRAFPVAHYKRKIAVLVRQIPSSNIIILGLVSPIAPVMAAANIIVFPATVGHFARPIIEAGYMKKVVIASDCPPLTELVVNNVTGFLVPSNNYTMWAEKMYILLTNKQLRDSMASAAYNFCLKRFSITNQIQIVQKLYESFFV